MIVRPAAPAQGLSCTLLKLVVDKVFTLFALILVLPLLAAISLLIRMTSSGTILFRHQRIGRNGALFTLWKFRTMYEDSHSVLKRYFEENPEALSEWKLAHKLRFDPRITPIGRFLRRYSLDELPQFLNVLTGDMSLVGPRPIVTAEAEKYGNRFGCYCKVKPGVTGLWQVSGRSTVSYEQRVSLDCHYVYHWTPWMEIRIILRTFMAVIRPHGAF
jgi:lipopolysaccharide/colanic/teichoic acid biosynthesis glycosyltransferase